MMNRYDTDFESSLIIQCAPTLASIKSANLFSIHFNCDNQLECDIDFWSNILNEKGIKIYVLRKNSNKALIYVYRYTSLEKDLKNTKISTYLSDYGYKENNINQNLENLKHRIEKCNCFPHEIGLFLSYPLIDVIGFSKHKGQNCSHCGYWKVYGDKKLCIKQFQNYDKCNDIYLKLWTNGRSVQKLTVTA